MNQLEATINQVVEKFLEYDRCFLAQQKSLDQINKSLEIINSRILALEAVAKADEKTEELLLIIEKIRSVPGDN